MWGLGNVGGSITQQKGSWTRSQEVLWSLYVYLIIRPWASQFMSLKKKDLKVQIQKVTQTFSEEK